MPTRTTVENTIERIRRQLNSTVRLEVNTLGSTLTTSTNPVTLSYDLANSVREGAVLSVGTELMRVMSINTAAKEVTVIRGWQDSDPEAHGSEDEVLINPRFTRQDIYDAMLFEIDSWAPDLYKLTDTAVTIAISDTGFELPLALDGALGVQALRRNFTVDDDAVWPEMAFTLQRGAAANLTPTEGTGLYVRFTGNTGYAKAAGTVLVRTAHPYESTGVIESVDLATTPGITSGMLELLDLGVKARVLADDETGRTGRGMQDEPRRTEEVPAGSVLTLAQTVLQRYERRRNQEVIRLRQSDPFRSW